MGARHRSPTCFSLWSLLFIFYSSSLCCYAANTIAQGQLIRDGETIISTSEKFALGFFSPGNSTLRYVGIWYHQIPVPSIVWVANRESPISGRDGVLTIEDDSNLTVLDGNGTSVWSTDASAVSDVNSTTAVLMDTGNLILRSNGGVGGTVWDSFSDPTDTFLPDMRINASVQEGERRVFTSWRSANDPSPGRYSMGIDPRGSPQIVIWDGLNRRWRSGHWNGLIFTGVPDVIARYQYGFRLPKWGDGVQYFTYTPSNSSEEVRFMITSDGNERQERWDEGEQKWSTVQSMPENECQLYNECGTFGICNAMDSPMCGCIEGYVPKYRDQWNNGNWSGGCVRRIRLQCEISNSSVVVGEDGGGDGFFKLEGVKLPDFLDHVGTEDIEECEEKCSQTCSCRAYAFVSAINCMMWNGDLVDIHRFTDGGNTLYIHLANSELGGKEKVTKLVIIATVVVGTFFLGVSIWLLWRFKLRAISKSWKKNNLLPEFVSHRSRDFSTDFSGQDDQRVEGQGVSGPELTYFNICSVAAATNNFSDENKLGQGGFGTVFKGKLPGGQEIAVKRLSKMSGQGLEEFKNEITLIARLQHRNLVRLLGCCIQGEEMMLIYEYMPNKSLDSFLFDEKKQSQLNWRRRFIIIEGIARGLLYLHRDSRLRIIHRDLKASNILLDEEMNSKISDFGMARIFGGNQNEANTNRVVGTYGYMAPEYAMEGLFSVKSDVYSLGVLLLEIVSGRKNTSFRSSDYYNIIGHAWDLWEGGKALELIDPSIANSCDQNEVLRCIHLAMLCVQDLAVHRPTMSMVVLMLESQSTALPMPREPTLTSMRSSVDLDLWRESHDMVSSNEITISAVTGR